MKLNLSDLKPEEATFTLDDFPDKTFTLKKFSLNAQLWMNERFGVDQVKGIFENRRLGEISELVFFLLKDKSVITSLEAFREAITSNRDRVAMMGALLKTIGISQPVMDKLKEGVETGNAESLNQLIGAQSST